MHERSRDPRCMFACILPGRISLFQGLQLDAIQTHKWTILRCSGITGSNLREGLAWVVRDARERLFVY